MADEQKNQEIREDKNLKYLEEAMGNENTIWQELNGSNHRHSNFSTTASGRNPLKAEPEKNALKLETPGFNEKNWKDTFEKFFKKNPNITTVFIAIPTYSIDSVEDDSNYRLAEFFRKNYPNIKIFNTEADRTNKYAVPFYKATAKHYLSNFFTKYEYLNLNLKNIFSPIKKLLGESENEENAKNVIQLIKFTTDYLCSYPKTNQDSSFSSSTTQTPNERTDIQQKIREHTEEYLNKCSNLLVQPTTTEELKTGATKLIVGVIAAVAAALLIGKLADLFDPAEFGKIIVDILTGAVSPKEIDPVAVSATLATAALSSRAAVEGVSYCLSQNGVFAATSRGLVEARNPEPKHDGRFFTPTPYGV